MVCILAALSIYFFSSLKSDYTIILYGNGAALDQEVYTVKQGEKADLPVPVKLDHTFAGWYQDTAFTKSFDPATTTVQKNLKLYAKYKKNSYTITLIDPSLWGQTDYNPNVFTKEAGSSFSFPTPRVLNVQETETLGNFLGYSTSMQNPQADKNNANNIIEGSNNPNTIFTGFFSQNVTYWVCWENYKCPDTIKDLANNTDIDIEFDLQQPEIYRWFVNEKILMIPSHPSYIMLTLPNLLGLSIMNDGYTSYSFAGWSLVKGAAAETSQTLYRDGEAVDLGRILQDFPQYCIESRGKTTITFYAVWKTI